MKIGIIGGGSIGLLFAHYLHSHHNLNVTIYVRSEEQAEKLLSEGLIFEKNGKVSKSFICSSVFASWTGREDLTIIAVKEYHLEQVLSKMREANPNYHGSLFFLQNGMGHLRWLRKMTAANIFIGSVEHGANRIGINHVVHTGEGVTRSAIFSGDSMAIIQEVAILAGDQFPFVYEDNYREMLVNKLIVNAIINPLTGILNIRNGELIENPDYFFVAKSLFFEISAILGVKAASFEKVKAVCRNTAANHSSMLKDLNEKRKTEIDAILGYILEEARQKKIHAPLAEGLYRLIRGKERRER